MHAVQYVRHMYYVNNGNIPLKFHTLLMHCERDIYFSKYIYFIFCKHLHFIIYTQEYDVFRVLYKFFFCQLYDYCCMLHDYIRSVK